MQFRDYLGEDASALLSKKLFLFDMDGTIYEENRLFDGTLDILDWIARSGGQYVFITNNSSKSVTDYLAKVRKMGIETDEEHFFTSAQATVLYLKENLPGKQVYCQGTRSLVRELSSAGIDVTCEVSEEAGAIVVGFDTELTFEKLEKTCKMLAKPIPYIATNPDFVCPTSYGFVPDCGSMCFGLEKATGRRPIVIGKPETAMIEIAMRKYGCTREETVILGDRLYTDIASGVNAGVTTICVLSGEATMEDIEKSDVKPTYIFENIRKVCDLLSAGK